MVVYVVHKFGWTDDGLKYSEMTDEELKRYDDLSPVHQQARVLLNRVQEVSKGTTGIYN